MTIDGNNLPAEVTIAVPHAYRDYLVQKRVVSLGKKVFWTVSTIVLIYAAFALVLHWKTGSIRSHILEVIVALAFVSSKLKELRPRTWQYVLSDKEFRLLWWTSDKDREWNWYTLNWQKDGLLRLEHDEWRGLPLLRFVTDNATPNLIMVYAQSDRDTVQTIVLPLIESYRKQYRHEFWVDTLRQDKPHDISH